MASNTAAGALARELGDRGSRHDVRVSGSFFACRDVFEQAERALRLLTSLAGKYGNSWTVVVSSDLTWLWNGSLRVLRMDMLDRRDGDVRYDFRLVSRGTEVCTASYETRDRTRVIRHFTEDGDFLREETGRGWLEGDFRDVMNAVSGVADPSCVLELAAAVGVATRSGPSGDDRTCVCAIGWRPASQFHYRVPPPSSTAGEDAPDFRALETAFADFLPEVAEPLLVHLEGGDHLGATFVARTPFAGTVTVESAPSPTRHGSTLFRRVVVDEERSDFYVAEQIDIADEIDRVASDEEVNVRFLLRFPRGDRREVAWGEAAKLAVRDHGARIVAIWVTMDDLVIANAPEWTLCQVVLEPTPEFPALYAWRPDLGPTRTTEVVGLAISRLLCTHPGCFDKFHLVGLRSSASIRDPVFAPVFARQPRPSPRIRR